MTTTTRSLQSSYDLWQEWATSRRAKRRGREAMDLLSEYVDPVEERHMMLPSNRTRSVVRVEEKSFENSFSTFFRSVDKVEINHGTASVQDNYPLPYPQRSTKACWPEDALEYSISSIVSLKMRCVRSRIPLNCYDFNAKRSSSSLGSKSPPSAKFSGVISSTDQVWTSVNRASNSPVILKSNNGSPLTQRPFHGGFSQSRQLSATIAPNAFGST